MRKYQSDGVREYFVYRAFNAEGELLYVGCTKRLKARWTEHKQMRSRMVAEAVHFKVQGPYTRQVARSLEREAICTEEPLHGWTPKKHAEKVKRDRWTGERIHAFVAEGMSFSEAAAKAIAEADVQFPDPHEHEQSFRTAVS